ncbi:MAG TPA: GGDEF domain-containing protein, partial [Vicinamibacteria bacterium]|nr:GGDEF domain-containing protein [Vicinamibacteria bacterium]
GAYGLGLLEPGAISPAWHGAATIFLAAASSFDSGAEWLLALGCVLAVSERVQRELVQTNAELILAQEDMRRMADRDALTGLDNRRVLPRVLRDAQPAGAILLFFDLDRFKQINDLHGHAAGDETLRRFAAGLRECFRPDDSLVRYAGDEFLVVARGLGISAVEGRVAALRERLRVSSDGPPIAFSVGVAELAPGGRPEDALRGADEAMYAAKRGIAPPS